MNRFIDTNVYGSTSGSCENGNIVSGFIEAGKFLDKMGIYVN